MVKVLVMPCKALTDPEYQKRACAFLSEERSAHAFSMKNESDRALSIGAGLLLAYGLLVWGNDLLDVSQIRLEPEEVLGRLEIFDERAKDNLTKRLITGKTEKGKPYFPWEGAPKFSISHSGDYAAVAYSDREVGLDIQRVQELKSPRIYDRVLHKSGKEKKEDFFFLWTAKEAYVKCTGEGLSGDFTNIYADREGMCIEDALLYELAAPEGYFLIACVKSV